MLLADKVKKTGDRIQTWWNNEKHPAGTYWTAYTVLFLALFSVIAMGFFIIGKSFIFSARMGDGIRQHYASLAYFGQYLREILYNLFVNHTLEIPMWDLHIGYGSDIITTLHYYVFGDPLNLLSVFVPQRYTEYLYDFLLVLRMYLAGLAFSAFCRYHKNGRYATLLGALLYAFSQWIMVAGFRHPFFINPCIYLPLVLIGVELVYKKKKYWVYVVTLAVSAISNFYFFYMLGIFTILYAVYRYFMLYKGIRLKELMGCLGRFALLSAIALMIASVIFLPSIMAVLGTNRVGADNYIPTVFTTKYYHMLLAALFGKYQSNYTVIGVSAVGTIGLFVLFANRRKNTALKVGFLMCMCFLFIPFIAHVFNGLSYATNRWCWPITMLNSYIFVKTYPLLFTLKKKQRMGILGAILLIAAYIFIDSYSRILWNILGILLLLVFAGIILLKYSYFGKHPRAAGTLLLGGICIGTAVNIYFCFTSAGNSVSGVWQFTDAGEAYEQTDGILIDEIKEISDISQYRYEQGGTSILQNSNMINELNGGQFFFSLANGYVSQFLDEMYSNRPYEQNFQDVNGRSFLMKLLSMKYFVGLEKYLPDGYEKVNEVIIPYDEDEKKKIENVQGEEEESLGEEIKNEELLEEAQENQEGHVIGIYEDEYALPLAYTYDSYIPRETYEEMNVMERQQAVLQGVVLEDSSLPVCEPEDESVEVSYTITPLENCELFENRIKAKEDNATCLLTFEGVPNSELYIAFDNLRYLEVNRRHKYTDEEWAALPWKERRTYRIRDESVANQADIYFEADLDGETTRKSIFLITNRNNFYNGRHNFMNMVGYSEEPVTSVLVTFSEKGSYKYDDLSVYFQPTDKLDSYASERMEDTAENLSIENNEISCQISLDEPKALVFAVPYGDGWTATVDGEEAELLNANTMFMALELSPGEHDIQLHYTTPYIKLGLVLTVSGLLLLAGCVVFEKKRRVK